MILLGQHGQIQDFNTGLEYIRLAAQSCDQNAPQGAYVSFIDHFSLDYADIGHRYTVCFWLASFLK